MKLSTLRAPVAIVRRKALTVAISALLGVRGLSAADAAKPTDAPSDDIGIVIGEAVWAPTKPPADTPVEKAEAPAAQTHALYLVRPAGVTGEVTGSIVDDGEKFKQDPELAVTAIQVATDGSWTGSFEGIGVDTGDGKLQPLSHAVRLPPTASGVISLLFRPLDHPAQPPLARAEIPVASSNLPVKQLSEIPASYATSAVIKGPVQKVEGPFAGDDSDTLAALNGRPIRVLASERGATFVDVSSAAAGENELVLSRPGLQPVAMAVNKYSLTATGVARTLQRGQTTTITFAAKDMPRSGHLTITVVNETEEVIKIAGQRGTQTKFTLKGPADSKTVKITAVRAGQFRVAYKCQPEFPQISAKPASVKRTSDRDGRSAVAANNEMNY